MCQNNLSGARCVSEIQRDELLEKLHSVQFQLAHALAELAVLRPPKAKFKVGQIVVRLPVGCAYTISAAQFREPDRAWYYSNRRDTLAYSWVPETAFRALSPKEAGLEPEEL